MVVNGQAGGPPKLINSASVSTWSIQDFWGATHNRLSENRFPTIPANPLAELLQHLVLDADDAQVPFRRIPECPGRPRPHGPRACLFMLPTFQHCLDEQRDVENGD
jgi:hypothetical protein